MLSEKIIETAVKLWGEIASHPMFQQATQFVAETYTRYPVFTQVVMALLVVWSIKSIPNNLRRTVRSFEEFFIELRSIAPSRTRARINEAIKEASFNSVTLNK